MRDSDIIRRLGWTECDITGDQHRYCRTHYSVVSRSQDRCVTIQRECAIAREGSTLSAPGAALQMLLHRLRTYVLTDLDDTWTVSEVQKNVRSAIADAEALLHE